MSAKQAPKFHSWADTTEEEEQEAKEGRAGVQAGGGGWVGLATPAPAQAHAPPQRTDAEVLAAGWAEISMSDGGGRAEVRGDWHEGLDVVRGASRQRLDLSHGFVRDIVSLAAPHHLHCLLWAQKHAAC